MIFKKILQRKSAPAKKPSPLVEEMQEVNGNLTQILAALANQKAPIVSVSVSGAGTATADTTSEFSSFESFDTGEVQG